MQISSFSEKPIVGMHESYILRTVLIPENLSHHVVTIFDPYVGQTYLDI